MCVIIVMSTICLLMLFISYTYATVMHELGHFRCACKMHPCEGIILVKNKAFVFFHLPGVHIATGCREMKTRGVTELSNEFQVYSAKEISGIAKAGHKAEAWWFVICGITAVTLEIIAATILSMFDNTAWAYGSIIITFTGLAMAAMTILLGPISYIRSRGNEWGDKAIAESPEEYIQYKAGRKDYERFQNYLESRKKKNGKGNRHVY